MLNARPIAFPRYGPILRAFFCAGLESMKILIITQIYLPEMGALANRLYPIVRELVAKGHDVTVATGMPSYPAGKVFPDYEGWLYHLANRIRDHAA